MIFKLRKKSSVKTKIILSTVLVLIISIFSITFMSAITITSNLESQMKINGLNLIKTVADDFKSNSKSLKIVENQLEEKIKAVAFAVKNSNMSNESLTSIATSLGVSEINYAGADRVIVFSNLPGNRDWQYPEDHPCYPLFTKEKTELMEAVRKSTTDNFSYKYGAIALEDGGIIQVGILAEEINKIKSEMDYQYIINNLMKNPDVVYALVIDKDLKALAHSDQKSLGIELKDKGSKTAAIDGKEYTDTYIYEANGKKQMVYEVVLPLFDTENNHTGALKVVLSMKTVTNAMRQVIRRSLFVSAILFVICVASLFFLTVIIIKPLENIIIASRDVSQGNLNHTVQVKTKDEIGILAHSFNDMVVGIKALVTKVKDVGTNVSTYSQELLSSIQQASSVSEQIAEATQDMAAGSMQQVKSADEAANHVKDIVDNISNVNSNVAIVINEANDIANLVHQGKKQMDTMIIQVQSIKNSVNESSVVIKDLEAISEEIGTIVEIIDSIAGQTNLLALNAAIEAARAGEAGRGFAVVADEVKKLAEQSTNSASEIKELIERTQISTKKALTSIETGNKEAETGEKLINSVDESFSRILRSFDTTKDKLVDVSSNMNLINNDTGNITKKIEEIENISEQYAANTEEIAASTEEQAASIEQITKAVDDLSMLISELLDSINKFN